MIVNNGGLNDKGNIGLPPQENEMAKALAAAPKNGVGGGAFPPPRTDASEVKRNEDGSMEFTFPNEEGAEDEQENQDKKDIPFDANLADYLDEDTLTGIGRKVLEWVQADDESRDEWKRTYIDGLELLGFKHEDRSDPWVGSCGVYHPVLTEAAVRFQSQAIMEIFPASGPVKTKVIGKWSLDKQRQAQRVQEELNYFVQDKMTEFRPETEQLLFYLALAGSAFRKTYFDPVLQRPTALFVPAEDFLVPYGTTDLRTAPRYTHVMRRYPNEIRKEVEAGFYRVVELSTPAQQVNEVENEKAKLEGRNPGIGKDERYTLYECHCTWYLQDDEEARDEEMTGAKIMGGVETPYVITVERDSQKVLAIRRNWKQDDPLRNRCQHFVPYHYLPGLGFYGSGLIHLIGGIAKSATSILRQLVDAGTLSNLPGGLKTRGLRIKGDDTPIMPGEFRDVDVPSGAIRDNITFLPYKEPSEVLHGLLNDIIAEGRRLGAAPDLPVNAMTQQAPVGTTLALLERSMKVMSAVQARLHASLKQDFKLIAEIIATNMGAQYEYEVDDAGASRLKDFSSVDIIPVSDPNASSMAQRVVQYQAALDIARQDPTAFDKPQLYRDMMQVLNLPNVDKIVKDPDNISPMDPVSENMALITGKPVKAFMWQDHQAHIQTHLAAIHDPKLMQMVAQSPQASLIQGAASSHIAEHLGFAYRAQIEQQMGVALPAPDQPLPPDVEVQLSRTVAVAAQRLLGKDMQEAQQQKAQQQQQDPVFQLQKQEADTKQQAVAEKAHSNRQKTAVELLKIAQKDKADKDRLATQKQIAGLNAGVKVADDRANKRQDMQKFVVDKMTNMVGDAAKRMHEHVQNEHQREIDRESNQIKRIAANKPRGGGNQ